MVGGGGGGKGGVLSKGKAVWPGEDAVPADRGVDGEGTGW